MKHPATKRFPLRTNSSMSRRSSKSGSRFIKILMGDFSQRLRIPPDFVKHIVMDASQTAKLKVPSGHSWCVQLSKMVTGTYLLDGWPEFVKDNSLKVSDFLLFEYDGSRHFTVRIFDKTACEREEVITCNTHRDTSGRTHRSSKKTCSDFGRHSQHILFGSGKNNQQSNPIDSLQTLRCNNTDSNKRKHMPTFINRCKKVRVEAVDVPMLKSKSSMGVCQREPLTKEQEKAFENAVSFSKDLRSPNCVLVMNKSSVHRAYMMCFPSCFVREHLPRTKTTFSLQDLDGRAWKVIYIPYVTGKGCLSGGWGTFARVKKLEIGDTCIFELVGERKMQVHVFHQRHDLLKAEITEGAE